MNIALSAALLLASTPAWATEVEVRVLNVADAAGSIRVEVCPKAEWLNGCTYTAHAPARAGVSTVVVTGVPPGEYGVIAHHDSNDDGEVNQNFLGVPTEGVGFSRDASFRFAPPHFNDAVLTIRGPRVVVDVTLHFERAHAGNR